MGQVSSNHRGSGGGPEKAIGHGKVLDYHHEPIIVRANGGARAAADSHVKFWARPRPIPSLRTICQFNRKQKKLVIRGKESRVLLLIDEQFHLFMAVGFGMLHG